MVSRRSTAVLLFALTAGLEAGCGQATPTTPASSPAAAPGAASSHEPVFPLAAGTVELASSNGSISGAYSGHASGIGEAAGAALAVLVTGGTGQYAGASGTLEGTGRGAFAGEGEFSLQLRGTLQTRRGPRPFRASIHGSSRLSCRDSTVLVLQSGSGTAVALGRIAASASHDIAAGAGCDVD